MGNAFQRDAGAYMTGRFALVPATITAGAGNDGVEVDGSAIDRLFDYDPPLSGTLLIPFRATLAGSSVTLSIAANLQHAPSSTGPWTDVTEPGTTTTKAISGVVATGTSAGSVHNGVAELNCDLSECQQYVRAQVTADLSSTATDTVALAAVLALTGFQNLPR